MGSTGHAAGPGSGRRQPTRTRTTKDQPFSNDALNSIFDLRCGLHDVRHIAANALRAQDG